MIEFLTIAPDILTHGGLFDNVNVISAPQLELLLGGWHRLFFRNRRRHVWRKIGENIDIVFYIMMKAFSSSRLGEKSREWRDTGYDLDFSSNEYSLTRI